MKKLCLLIVLISILLSGCSAQPSENQIQTAIAQTQAANPTATVTATNVPTLTATPTETATPTLVPTDTPTPTATPDLRIITMDPQKFLLTKSDLPKEGLYFVPNERWMSISTNEEIISGWTVEEGRDYVITTGREIGWWVAFARGTRAVAMPEEIYCQVVRYKTKEGALLSLTKYGVENRDTSGLLKIVETEMDLGDFNVSYITKKITSGGDYQVAYDIYFSYHNFIVNVEGYGLEKDVSHEFIEDLARKVLAKLEAANLEEPIP